MKLTTAKQRKHLRVSLYVSSALLLSSFGANGSNALATPSSSPANIVSLQQQHPPQTPAEALQTLAQGCNRFGIDTWDVYGDFHVSHNTDGDDDNRSWLRTFEEKVAVEFGKEDAVVMPSGVMAQQIALLINRSSGRFACHASSHLLLHEQKSYHELLGMECSVIYTKPDNKDDWRIPAPTLADLERLLEENKELDTIILELPNRELGGKCTSWDDLVQLRKRLDSNPSNTRLHCDGARIFEATSYYDGKSLQEIAALFDSVYISFYKGLGGMSGAMLLGDASFCKQARVWLRRFGGNLYTLLPYAVSGMVGYNTYWIQQQEQDTAALSFLEKKGKLKRLVEKLSSHPVIGKILEFDPKEPEVNMVHGYLRHHSVDTVTDACDKVVAETGGVRVLSRIRAVEPKEPAYGFGFRSKFELTLGEYNGRIDDDMFVDAWAKLCALLITKRSLGNRLPR